MARPRKTQGGFTAASTRRAGHTHLLAVDDFSRVGAMRLRGTDGTWQRTTTKGSRTTPRSQAPTADLRQLWRRLVCNLQITNLDDHLQNHRFLHVERWQWRLAPALEINPFPNNDRESKIWLTEQDGPITDVQKLLYRAPNFALNQMQAHAVRGAVHPAASKWREVALSAEVGLRTNELEDFAPAFEHGQMDIAAARIDQ